MAAVILFLVPVFHGVVFSGLAFWFQRSQKPRAAAARRLAVVFAVAGALANIVLSIVLIELLGGLSVFAGQGETSLVAHLPPLLFTQPVFMVLVYIVAKNIFSPAKD